MNFSVLKKNCTSVFLSLLTLGQILYHQICDTHLHQQNAKPKDFRSGIFKVKISLFSWKKNGLGWAINNAVYSL